MALSLPREIEKELPPRVRSDLATLTEEQQRMFVDLYKKQKRQKGLMVALSIIFPIQMFFLGKIGLGVLFLLTGGGMSVWYIIEWFLTPKRTDTYNEERAEEILADIKVS